MMLRILLLYSSLWLVSCSYKETVSKGKAVSFETDIKPVVSDKCVECHNTKGNDWRDYTTIFNKKDSVFLKVVIEKSMPLGKPFSDENRDLFNRWYLQGGPK